MRKALYIANAVFGFAAIACAVYIPEGNPYHYLGFATIFFGSIVAMEVTK